MKKLVLVCLFMYVWHFAWTQHAWTYSLSAYSLVPITWVDNVTGDFSFVENWQYPSGVSRNEWGQLVGWFSFDEMPCEYYDEFDRLRSDSAAGYYKRYVDTTHLHHNFYWENNCHTDWRRDTNRTISESGDILTMQMLGDTLYLINLQINCDCKLRLKLIGDTCYFLNAAYDGELDFLVSKGLSGYFKLDKQAWKEGIVKAEFHLNFRHSNPVKNYYWNGRILARKSDAEEHNK